VIGSFVKAGNVFATDVKVLDARTKKLIKSANVKSEGLAGILNSQIDFISEEIVRGVVQSSGEIESVQLRIADVSTTSMEAYNHFLKGKEEFERLYYYEAMEHFERVMQIDSTFAVAHLYLGLTQYYVWEVKKFKTSFSNSEKYKNSAAERERIYIEALYSNMIDRNIDKSNNILEKVVTRYPNEKLIHFWLAYNYYWQSKFPNALIELDKVLKLDPDYGLAYKLIGKTYGEKGDFEKALDYTNKYISLYPQNADSYYSLGFLYFRMGKIDLAIDQLKMSFKIKEDYGASAILATLFSLKEDYSETIRWENKIISMWDKESMKSASTWWSSFYDFWTGNINKAFVSLEKMLGKKNQAEAVWIARADWLRGWIYYDRGNYEKSRQYFNRFFIQEYRNRFSFDTVYISTMNYFYQGLVNLKMGKIDSARINLKQMISISNEINKDYPYNIQSNYNLLYGMVLIKEDSLNKAEDILKNNPPFKLPSQRLSSWGMIYIFIDPLLQDGLARIYAKKGNLDKAIDVYEKLISQDLEIRGFHLIHPKYHYRLAKLYEEKGWKEKAISEYEKFLKIYINADKDLPDYIDAKRRLSKLAAK
jgi:pentatricopeptide repeat protein